jgi:hypothetical protein
MRGFSQVGNKGTRQTDRQTDMNELSVGFLEVDSMLEGSRRLMFYTRGW